MVAMVVLLFIWEASEGLAFSVSCQAIQQELAPKHERPIPQDPDALECLLLLLWRRIYNKLLWDSVSSKPKQEGRTWNDPASVAMANHCTMAAKLPIRPSMPSIMQCSADSQPYRAALALAAA